MKEDFDYSQVPQMFQHCLHASCPRSADCLRFQIVRYAGPNVSSFTVVNPAYVEGKEDECRYFRSSRLTRFALGVTHLFDSLPHAKAVEIKRRLFNHFERNTYYRIQNKERYIKPNEQLIIRELFRKLDIQEEPVFDEYIDKYDWS